MLGHLIVFFLLALFVFQQFVPHQLNPVWLEESVHIVVSYFDGNGQAPVTVSQSGHIVTLSAIVFCNIIDAYVT